MIVVHHAPRTRSLRVLWMLEEMGLPYETRSTPVFGERSEAFLEANPARMVPLFEDGPVRMVESTAILHYLGDRYGPTPLVPDRDDPAYPRFLQHLHLGEASLGGILTIAILSKLVAPDDQKANWGGQAARDVVAKRFSLVSKALREGPYMAGETFTAADISVAWPIGVAELLGVELKDPALLDYYGRVTARPAYQRAAAVGAELEAA